MNKKGFIDTEVLFSRAFIILLLFGWGATILGYILGKQMGFPPFPLTTMLVILLGELIAAYVFAAKNE